MTIDEGAFADCYQLTKVIIPASVTKIGRGAFKGCTALERIEIANASNWYRTTDKVAWNNLSGGMVMGLSDPVKNAEFLAEKYITYYFYKT